MEVLLLGPPAVLDDGAERVLSSNRQAAVLTMLALTPRRAVPAETLVDVVWHDTATAGTRNTVQVHVSALRRLLGRGAIESAPTGYRLTLPAGATDVERFAALTRRAEEMARTGAWAPANRLYRSALALWRGRALDGLDGPWFDDHREDLHRQQFAAHRGRLATDLHLGRHLVVLPELARWCREHPYNEDLCELLMLAQYRAGRLDEALATYQAMRHRLVEDLGTDPGPNLARLHATILRRDPALDLNPESRTLPASSAPPPAAGAMVGRQGEIAQLEGRLAGRPGPTTLVGPSGVGKTRLAVEAARRLQGHFRDGVAIVDLEPSPAVADLTARIADTLGRNRLQDPATELVTLDALVVLDGVDTTNPHHADLVDVVGGLGSLTILATAHRPCGWHDEHVHPVRPLPVDHAAELLLLRAAAAGAELPEASADTGADARACAELLEGMPLAVELAASRAVLGLGELRATLEQERRRGAAAVGLSFAASVRDRDPAEHDLLRLLAHCAGPVDGDWVRHLPGQDPERVMAALAALVRDGLATRHEGTHGQQQYQLLSGVRIEVSTSGDAGSPALARDIVAAHAAWLAREKPGPSVLESATFSRRVRAHLDAAEGAMTKAMELGMHRECLDIAATLMEHSFVVRPGTLGPVFEALTRPATLVRLDLRDQVRALDAAAQWWEFTGDIDTMSSCVNEALVRARRLGEAELIAHCIGSSLMRDLVHHLDVHEDPDEALTLLGEGTGAGLTDVAGIYMRVGSALQDRPLLHRAVTCARRAGHDGLLAISLANLSETELAAGDAASAAALASESVAIYADMHLGFMRDVITATLASARAVAGSARDLARVADQLEDAAGYDDPRFATDLLLKVAAGLRAVGDDQRASAAVGLYRCILTTHQLETSLTEQIFLDSWLTDLTSTQPGSSVHEELAAIVAAARGLPAPASPRASDPRP